MGVSAESKIKIKAEDKTKEGISSAQQNMGKLTESFKQIQLPISETTEALKSFQQESEKIASGMIQLSEESLKAMSSISIGMGHLTDVVSTGTNIMFQNKKTELENWYKSQKKYLEYTIQDEEARNKAIENLDAEMDRKRKELQRQEAISRKKMGLFETFISTAQGIMSALAMFPPRLGLAAFIGAMGATKLAMIGGQEIPSFQEGGDFYTHGPQMIMVGDNPGGREHVRIDQTSSGGSGGDMNTTHEDDLMINNIYIDGERLFRVITRGIRNKQIPVYKGALTNI